MYAVSTMKSHPTARFSEQTSVVINPDCTVLTSVAARSLVVDRIWKANVSKWEVFGRKSKRWNLFPVGRGEPSELSEQETWSRERQAVLRLVFPLARCRWETENCNSNHRGNLFCFTICKAPLPEFSNSIASKFVIIYLPSIFFFRYFSSHIALILRHGSKMSFEYIFYYETNKTVCDLIFFFSLLKLWCCQ